MYVTVAEFKAAFPDQESVILSNLDDPDATTTVDDRICEALRSASTEADSYLGNVISLPLETIPPVIKPKIIDIARYRLDIYNPSDDVRKRYEDAIAWFKLAAKGEASLGLSADRGSQEIGAVRYFAQPRIFTRQSIADY